MPKLSFSLWESDLLTNSVVSGNGSFDLAVSSEISNSNTAYRSLKLVVDYESVVPEFGAIPQTFDIACVVEGESTTGAWFPVAYQFSPFRRESQGRQRIIQLQPQISGFDAGVDDIIYFGDATQARVSRQQGNLPDTKFRVRLVITERDYGGPGSFQSLVVSAYGEAFDV